jgi:hypothetical protein
MCQNHDWTIAAKEPTMGKLVMRLSLLGAAMILASVFAHAQGPASKAKVAVGKNVWLEVQGKQRRVLIEGTVCLREGNLEEFMCKKFTKEHESIVNADVDARDIHKALMLAGAEPGSPAQFQPKYVPARGPVIKVSVEYVKDGKTVTAKAQSWIKNIQTKKEMSTDWVFAGSQLVKNPLEKDKPPYYLANGGDIISIANFESSLLDIPVRSTAEDADLVYEAFTDRIPALETKLLVILEPVVDSKPAKK